MTSEEQLKEWAEGRNIHGGPKAHGDMECLSPPARTEEEGERRVWRCRECQMQGTWRQMQGMECPVSRGQCVPDFSCCKPVLAVSPEVRRAFVAADGKARDRLSVAFLSAAIKLGLEEAGREDAQVAIVHGDELPSS